ncbi:hypothetical protein KW805_02405 [Candidatus Pacearchaeota archaeon]|nr:hypothetical protein [Candidatus Pacearchaeota archaeon]
MESLEKKLGLGLIVGGASLIIGGVVAIPYEQINDYAKAIAVVAGSIVGIGGLVLMLTNTAYKMDVHIPHKKA